MCISILHTPKRTEDVLTADRKVFAQNIEYILTLMESNFFIGYIAERISYLHDEFHIS